MVETPAPDLEGLVRRVHAQLRPSAGLGHVQVAFYTYVDTKSTVRQRDGVLRLRLSDHLQGAPDAVLEGVVGILLARFYGLPENRVDPEARREYDAYLREERVRRRRSDSRRDRGRKHIEPVGRHRSLLESCLRVQLDLELHLPQTPRLSWSRTDSRRRFGHWDPDHGCIVVSQTLDDAKVPEFVLDYVVYHELLHIVHPVEETAGRRRIHSAAFRRDERRFARWREAERWLERLARRGPRSRRVRA